MNTAAPIKVYVVRHGKTIFNAMDKIQGVANAPLIESGKQEIHAIGKHYATRGWEIHQTFHSIAPRTRETLAILQEELGLRTTPIEADDVEEWNFGSFEGFDNGKWLFLEVLPQVVGKSSLEEMTCDEIANALHTIDTLGIAPSWESLRDRIKRGFEGVARVLHQRQENGLIVSHGMTMLALYFILTGETILSGSIKNGGLLELTWDGNNFTIDALEPNILGVVD